jgi:hypothetical protein
MTRQLFSRRLIWLLILLLLPVFFKQSCSLPRLQRAAAASGLWALLISCRYCAASPISLTLPQFPSHHHPRYRFDSVAQCPMSHTYWFRALASCPLPEVGTSKEIHKVLAKTLLRTVTRIGYIRSLQGCK